MDKDVALGIVGLVLALARWAAIALIIYVGGAWIASHGVGDAGGELTVVVHHLTAFVLAHDGVRRPPPAYPGTVLAGLP